MLAISGLAASVMLASCSAKTPLQPQRPISVQNADSHRAAVPADICRAWMEAELAAEVRRGLEPLLPSLGWDTPGGRSMVDRALPAAFSERFRIDWTHKECYSTLATKETPRNLQSIKRWFDRCYSDATARRFTDMGGARPENDRVIDPLPDDPALRVVIAMQTDWLGFMGGDERSGAKSNPKGTMDGRPSAEAIAEKTRMIAECRKEGAALIADALARAVASPGFAGERVQLLGLLIIRLDRRDFDIVTHLGAAELYAARPDANPWLASLYRGVVLQERAWLARGDDTIARTTERQLDSFQKGLDECYGPLSEAHRLAPQRPHAAGVLIRQALGTNNPRHETPEYWFQLATAADPAWFDAYSRLASTTLDRWGGGERDRLSMLRRMQRAALYPGGGAVAMLAPDLLLRAREDDPYIFSNRELLVEIQGCLRPLWKGADATTAIRTGVDPDEAWSLSLILAAKNRDVTTAWAVLDEPGRTFIKSALDEFKANWIDIVRWALENHPTDGPAYKEMRAVIAAGDMPKAAKLATELVAAAKSPRTAEAARSVLALCDLDRRLTAGETIDLVDPALRSLWVGEPSVLAKCFTGDCFSLRVVTPGDSPHTHVPLRLSGRYRIEIAMQLPPRNPKLFSAPYVRFLLGPAPRGQDWDPRLLRLTASNADFQTMGEIKSRRREQKLTHLRKEPLNQLVIDVDGPRANIYLNGALWEVLEAAAPAAAHRESSSSTPPTAANPEIAGVFGIGESSTNPDDVVTIKAIRVSRPTVPLAEAPPELPK